MAVEVLRRELWSGKVKCVKMRKFSLPLLHPRNPQASGLGTSNAGELNTKSRSSILMRVFCHVALFLWLFRMNCWDCCTGCNLLANRTSACCIHLEMVCKVACCMDSCLKPYPAQNHSQLIDCDKDFRLSFHKGLHQFEWIENLLISTEDRMHVCQNLLEFRVSLMTHSCLSRILVIFKVELVMSMASEIMHWIHSNSWYFSRVDPLIESCSKLHPPRYCENQKYTGSSLLTVTCANGRQCS